jgi:hypothetical protein
MSFNTNFVSSHPSYLLLLLLVEPSKKQQGSSQTHEVLLIHKLLTVI